MKKLNDMDSPSDSQITSDQSQEKKEKEIKGKEAFRRWREMKEQEMKIKKRKENLRKKKEEEKKRK